MVVRGTPEAKRPTRLERAIAMVIGVFKTRKTTKETKTKIDAIATSSNPDST
jgi:hypothetical protein